jgi:hypothetical protein
MNNDSDYLNSQLIAVFSSPSGAQLPDDRPLFPLTVMLAGTMGVTRLFMAHAQIPWWVVTVSTRQLWLLHITGAFVRPPADRTVAAMSRPDCILWVGLYHSGIPTPRSRSIGCL